MDLPSPNVHVFMTEEQQYEFLKLLAKEISKDYEFGSTFQEESWSIVTNQMQRMNPHLSVAHLKAKLRIFTRKYWLFSTLLARRGVQWDRRTNSMTYARPGVWISYSLEYPKGYPFRYEGIQPRLFDAMRDVFEAGVAID
ncbi:hypothetical protein MTR67_037896 [Solanum verrucosum]|uniref:Myb/SANT-like domain-containing protein n=1 Tax=Solanum verrucosum TaxID=315347 RepID=A0AAF0UF59_SOLVR|nr:hypothetical protein MTR67_037896 [Solanum verrucosum]